MTNKVQLSGQMHYTKDRDSSKSDSRRPQNVGALLKQMEKYIYVALLEGVAHLEDGSPRAAFDGKMTHGRT